MQHAGDAQLAENGAGAVPAGGLDATGRPDATGEVLSGGSATVRDPAKSV
ncbi:hypothetical protein CZ774_05685 [Frigoribacterium sp. JB110]|nr:hypothetical protein CZ774_05685 [Frigoribacterium sp. JB110]